MGLGVGVQALSTVRATLPPLWSIPRLVVLDSEGLVADQPSPKSRQTSSAVSARKTAPPQLCRLAASGKNCARRSDIPACGDDRGREVDGSSARGNRFVLPHWSWSAEIPPPALGPVASAGVARSGSIRLTFHRAQTAACVAARPAC